MRLVLGRVASINSVKRALVLRPLLSLESGLLSGSFFPLLGFLWIYCGSVIVILELCALTRELRAAIRQSSKLKIENHGPGLYLPTPKPLFAEWRAIAVCLVKY